MNDAVGPEALISVIVPTLNEADHLAETVRHALQGERIELIVVDGGSTDATRALAGGLKVRLIESPPGRARQMNAGAAAAGGEIFLFLHADTHLPHGFDGAIRRTLRRPGVAAGAFGLRIDAPGKAVRWIERGADLRARILGMPYGDQALFVSAAAFWALGGFPQLPIMEDFVLVRRLGRRGRVVTLRDCVRTSGRRWQRRGVLRTTLINQVVVAAFYLGVAPNTLARWYRGRAAVNRG